MLIKLNDKKFMNDMMNIIEYSIGFLDGVQGGKKIFLDNLGRDVIELLKEYVDSNARVSPETLHHIYEWYMVGSPNARLFDIDYSVSGIGLSFKSSFRQSTSIQDGSNTPFYNKAYIMENGIPVTIRPKKAQALQFDVNGEEVFTKAPVKVNNPGGNTENQFENVINTFFNRYFTQAFLSQSGLLRQLGTPTAYKKNIAAGAKQGKSKGVETGYRWIANVKVGA